MADVACDRIGNVRGVLGGRPALGRVHVCQQDDELVAGLAADHVGLARNGSQSLGYAAQELVADRPAEALVDKRELVDVDEDDRGGRAVPNGAVKREVEVLGEHREVRQFGERIVLGKEVEPVGDGAKLGDVDKREQGAARPAVSTEQRGLGHDRVALGAVAPGQLELEALTWLDLVEFDELGEGGRREVALLLDAEHRAHRGVHKQRLTCGAGVPQPDWAGGQCVEALLGQVHVALDLDALHELRELVSDRAHQLQQRGVMLAR